MSKAVGVSTSIRHDSARLSGFAAPHGLRGSFGGTRLPGEDATKQLSCEEKVVAGPAKDSSYQRSSRFGSGRINSRLVPLLNMSYNFISGHLHRQNDKKYLLLSSW